MGTGITPSPEELGLIRTGAQIQQLKPYIDNEVLVLQKSVISFVLAAANSGTLTPEIAFAKWMEYIAYQKLLQKFDQRVSIGASIGANRNLDIKG